MKLDLASALDFYGVRYRIGAREQRVLCPVHSDSTPSMSVNLDEHLWMCHACGKGGTPLNLIMEMEGLDEDGSRTFASNNGIEAIDSEGSDGAVSLGYLPGRRVVRKKRHKRGKPRPLFAWDR